ncbi:hypothetical protein BD779DRAFT_1390034, partial [Infundibulicybe gibba]
ANNAFFNIPESLKNLCKELLGGYTCPESQPDEADINIVRELTESEQLTLRHYIAWKKSSGTVKAYKLHAQVLQSTTQMPILSLYSVQKLAQKLTGFSPQKVDMCPKSCIAYTGKYESKDKCPFVHPRRGVCGEMRYKTVAGKQQPRAQVQILPVMATIRAMFLNAETSSEL